jgi:predicted nucleic acid-binding protein
LARVIVLDASVLIAHLWPSDHHHMEASAFLRRVAGDRMLTHPLTMAEVLVGGVRIGRGAEMRQDLIEIGIELADRDADEPLRLAEIRVSTRLKLPDCCVLDVAFVSLAKTPATEAVTLGTFDRALAGAAIDRGVLVAPDSPVA